MKALVLAAGQGVRMGDLTRRTPKPLLKVGGRSLIERQLERLAAAGVREFVINLSHLGSQVRAHVDALPLNGLKIDYSEEGQPPLETGGGILRALPLLGDEPFLVVNSDVVSDFDFARLRGLDSLGKLILVDNPEHNLGGDFGIDIAGRATFEPPLLTFTGISLLDPRLFAGWPQGRQPLKPILDAAIGKRQLSAERHDGVWVDVGTPERLARADELDSKGKLR
jgi:MurNAc alpha-1-phosphate uridylyltransferase